MEGVMEDFLYGISMDAVPYYGDLFNNFAEMIMYLERYIGDMLATDALNTIYNYIYIVACSLLALKVLRKGFSVYIIGRDGDADESPREMIVSIALAIVCASIFPLLYGYLADIALWFANDLVVLIVGQTIPPIVDSLLAAISTFGKGIVGVIMILVYLIALAIFWFQVLRRSVEMLILRVSFPLACIGLLDSDGGIFKAYSKILCQSAFTMIVQIICFNISFLFIEKGHAMFGIGAMMAAISGPTLMASILANTGGSGNVGHKIQQTVSIANTLRSFGGK